MSVARWRSIRGERVSQSSEPEEPTSWKQEFPFSDSIWAEFCIFSVR
jgi:hypothetical protein